MGFFRVYLELTKDYIRKHQDEVEFIEFWSEIGKNGMISMVDQ